MTKICKRCGESKPVDQFSIQEGMKDGLRADCRSCSNSRYKEYCRRNPDKVKDSYYRRVYGISLAEYLDMLAHQDDVCAICGKPETAAKKSMAVDHDPVTGAVRRLLCHKCNAGLGHFNDDPALLEAAARYLQEHAPASSTGLVE